MAGGRQKTSAVRAHRDAFHAHLREALFTSSDDVPNIADRGSKTSTAIARLLFRIMDAKRADAKKPGQVAGGSFEETIGRFVELGIQELAPVRPGSFVVLYKGAAAGGGARRGIENFYQYDHLHALAEALKENKTLWGAFGGDYFIQPDVVVIRHPEPDDFFDHGRRTPLLDEVVPALTPLLARNHRNVSPASFLHASISCKWTLRSDRAQNARTEALNLIRNRNGRVPHIAAVTAEPLPTRIQSLALGSGDLDCVYHVALPELEQAVAEAESSADNVQREALENLIRGKRLRDIADLPFDLTI